MDDHMPTVIVFCIRKPSKQRHPNNLEYKLTTQHINSIILTTKNLYNLMLICYDFVVQTMMKRMNKKYN